MKKRLAIFGLISSVILVLFGVVAFARAQENSVAVIEKGEVYEGNYYTNKGEVKIKGELKGTLYAYATKKIDISGKIDGDIVAASSKITISGEVDGDARLAAQNIKLNGIFKKDVSAAALMMETGDESVISGDLNSYSSNMKINGTIEGGVVSQSFDTFRLNGRIKGNAFINAGVVDLGKNAKFESDLSYQSLEEVDKIGDKTKGRVDYRADDNKNQQSIIPAILLVAGAFTVMWLVVIMLAPRFFERSRILTNKDFLKTSLHGMSVLFLPWILAILLLVSFYGFALALLIILSWCLVMMVSGAFFVYYLGSFFFKNSNSVLVRGVAGSVVSVLLFFIPFINLIAVPLMIFFGCVLGSGMFVRTLLENNRGPGISIQNLDIDNLDEDSKENLTKNKSKKSTKKSSKSNQDSNKKSRKTKTKIEK